MEITQMENKTKWYTICYCGSGPVPALGPWPTVEQAESAIENFRGRHGQYADTYLISSNVRIAGPFETRESARRADISDAPLFRSAV